MWQIDWAKNRTGGVEDVRVDVCNLKVFDELYVFREKNMRLKEIWWFQVGSNLLQDQLGVFCQPLHLDIQQLLYCPPRMADLQTFARFHELLAETNSSLLKIDPWSPGDSYWKRPILRGELLGSGRVSKSMPFIFSQTLVRGLNNSPPTLSRDRCVVQLFHAKHFPDLRLLVMSKRGEVKCKFKLVKCKKVVFEMLFEGLNLFWGRSFHRSVFLEPEHGCE